MTNFLQEVKDKIDKKLNAEEVLLVDNSSLHSKHKSFDSKKFHLKLIIKSKQLQKLLQKKRPKLALKHHPQFCQKEE